jgi:hypothetical protein
MTGIAVPVLLAVLAQSADRGKEPQPAPFPDQPQASPSAPAPSTPGDKAFNRLFTVPAPPPNPDRDPSVAVPVPDQKPASRIVCGMVVIQVDPNVDPRFIIRAPADTTAYKIRRFSPPVCAD